MSVTEVILAIALFVVCLSQGLLIHVFFKQSTEAARTLDKVDARLEKINTLIDSILKKIETDKKKEKVRKEKRILKG